MVALHPEYIHSYAPAQVVAVFPQGCSVKFYDDVEGKLQKRVIYKVSQNRYNKFVNKIKMAEEKLTNHDAITLDRRTGEYKLSMEALPYNRILIFSKIGIHLVLEQYRTKS